VITEPKAFYNAIQNGKLKEVEEFLKVNPSLLELNTGAATPLHWAAFWGREEVAAFLVAGSANVDAKNGAGQTPLHEAASNGQLEVTKVLLSNGADVNSKDNGGWTPLHTAASGGHPAVVNVLLAAGAEVNAKNNKRETPLHWAVGKRHIGVVGVLLAYRADIDAQDQSGMTPRELCDLPVNQPRDRSQLGHIAAMIKGDVLRMEISCLTCGRSLEIDVGGIGKTYIDCPNGHPHVLYVKESANKRSFEFDLRLREQEE